MKHPEIFKAIMAALSDTPAGVNGVGVQLVEPRGHVPFFEVSAQCFPHGGEWTKIPCTMSPEDAAEKAAWFLGAVIKPRGDGDSASVRDARYPTPPIGGE